MDKYVELAAQVVADFVANQHVNPNDIPALIESTYKTLWEIGHPTPQAEPEVRQRRQRRSQPVAQTEGETTAEENTQAGDSYGWGENGERIVPEPMFDDEA